MPKDTKQVYTDEQVTAHLEKSLPQWELRDGWIRRKYKTGGWQHTMMVVNAVAHIAEAACHHPDLAVSYGEVHVKLSTHSEKGITDNDFELAQLIEDHLTWRPAEDDALDGYEAGMKKKWTR